MTIGIINAMHKEHEQARSPSGRCERSNLLPFFIITEGTLNGHRLVLTESGIGKSEMPAVGAVENSSITISPMTHQHRRGRRYRYLARCDDVVAGSRVAYRDVARTRIRAEMFRDLPLYYEADPKLLAAAQHLQAGEPRGISTGTHCSGAVLVYYRPHTARWHQSSVSPKAGRRHGSGPLGLSVQPWHSLPELPHHQRHPRSR